MGEALNGLPSRKELLSVLGIVCGLCLSLLVYIWSDAVNRSKSQDDRLKTVERSIESVAKDTTFLKETSARIETAMVRGDSELSATTGSLKEEQDRRRPLLTHLENMQADQAALRLLLEERRGALQQQLAVFEERLKGFEMRFDTMSRRILSLNQRLDHVSKPLPMEE